MSGHHRKVRGLGSTAGALALTALIGTVASSTGTALAVSGTAARPVSATGSTLTEGGRPWAAGAAMAHPAGSGGQRFTASRSGGRSRSAASAVTGGRDGATGRTARVLSSANGTSPRAGDGKVRVRRKQRRVTAGDVIKLARSQVRTHEDKWGRTKYQAWYVRTRRAAQTAKRDGGKPQGYRSAAWCDMFVSWVGDRTGSTSSMGSDAYTVAHAKWFKARHRWGYRPKPGAVVFFNWGGRTHDVERIDHVGLVVRTVRHGTIQTVEGNAGNAVVMKNRPSSAVVGYGYPDYDH